MSQFGLQDCSPVSFDWNDLRYFVAVLEHGSTKRAAASMRVEQTTVARRVAALESGLGLQLFDRTSGRYRPTPAALSLKQSADAAVDALRVFSDAAAARRRAATHKIRLTAEDSLAERFIIPAVARFAELYPEIQVEIDLSREYRDLEGGEADMAVRPVALDPPDPCLVGRKLIDDPYGIYCSEDYPCPPRSREDMKLHPIVCLESTLPRIEAAGLGSNVRHVVNAMSGVAAMIRKGVGVGGLPRSVADAVPGLQLCFELLPTSVWVFYPQRMRGMPGVKELGEVIARQFKAAPKPVP
jgi:DNA-binding transcriptional LysR family regulator